MIDHFERLNSVYGYLLKYQETVWAHEYFGPSFEATRVLVWRGYTKDLAEELHMTHAVAHDALTKLSTIGCISLMLRGSKTNKSVYMLHYPPTAELWENQLERDLVTGRFYATTKDQRNADAINRLREQIRKLERRVEMLERGKID